MTIEYLDRADYVAIAAAVTELDVATLLKVTSLDLADSALLAPAAGFGDTAFCPDFIDKAAVLIVRLARNHPLPDATSELRGWRCIVRGHQLVALGSKPDRGRPKRPCWRSPRASGRKQLQPTGSDSTSNTTRPKIHERDPICHSLAYRRCRHARRRAFGVLVTVAARRHPARVCRPRLGPLVYLNLAGRSVAPDGRSYRTDQVLATVGLVGRRCDEAGAANTRGLPAEAFTNRPAFDDLNLVSTDVASNSVSTVAVANSDVSGESLVGRGVTNPGRQQGVQEMSFTFEEFKTAVETYPESFVTIEIIDVSLDGDVMGVEDTGSFDVKIVNTGALHMDDVTLIVTGLNGMLVREGLPGSYVTEFETSVIERVNAHDTNGHILRGYLYQAPDEAQPAKNLIRASLGDWNGNLEHITIGHSDPLTTVKGVFSSSVRAE